MIIESTLILPIMYIGSISCILAIILCRPHTTETENDNKQYQHIPDKDHIIDFDTVTEVEL